MLIQVQPPALDAATAAVGLVHGGLPYSRVRPGGGLSGEFTRTNFYSRGVPEWRVRASLKSYPWKKPRRLRVGRPARPGVRPGRPPVVTPAQIGRPARRAPEGLGVLLEPDPETAAWWDIKLSRAGGGFSSVGSPTVDAIHRKTRRFTRWGGTPRRRGYQAYPVWGFRPFRGGDPLLGLRDFWAPAGVSVLGGFRGGATRVDTLVTRWSRLGRRRRRHRLFLGDLRRSQTYYLYHWGNRRRALPGPARRAQLFQRRRLRASQRDWRSRKNVLSGFTRRGFHVWQPNRWATLERAALLGGPYYEARAERDIWLLGSRVGNPLEYRLVRPADGRVRLRRYRRGGLGRRFKLGQDTRFAPAFVEARRRRWTWFETTGLGEVLGLSRGAPTSPPGEGPPPGLAAAVYWSSHRWGRSRWTNRPTGRGVSVFVDAVKSGYAVELENQSYWGTVSASATGVFLSLVAELELKQPWSPPAPPEGPAPRRARRPRRWSSWVGLRARWWTLQVGRLGWTLCGPLWWLYSGVARGICGAAWLFHGGYLYGRTLASLPGVWLDYVVGECLFRPARAWIIHTVKDTRWFKVMGWIHTSALLVWSSEDDHHQVELNPIEAVNDETQENYHDELDDELDYEDDEIEDGIHAGSPRQPIDGNGWAWNLEEDWEDLLEHAWEFLDDLLYWAGGVCQPFFDFLVRWPLWTLLEGISLAGLVSKLEFQRGWSRVLQHGGLHRGRWWKVPLILVRLALGVAVWLGSIYVVGSQLEYSTLRVELVCGWGLTWFEEYWLAWWMLVTLGVTKVLGPRGVKDFFFTQVGWSNLVGLFLGTAEVADPEEYYPGRPVYLAKRVFDRIDGDIGTRDPSFYNLYHPITRADNDFTTERSNVAHDRSELIEAYGYHPTRHDTFSEEDEPNYFRFPLHLAHALDIEDSEDDPYGQRGCPPPLNDMRLRGWREPHLGRNNRYVLPFGWTRGHRINHAWYTADTGQNYQPILPYRGVSYRTSLEWNLSDRPGHSE